MTISERLMESSADVRDQASAYVARAAEAARARADRAAEQVAAAKTPVEVLTAASLKLNNLSHQYLSRLLARQGQMLKGTLTEGEKRLQRLARAATLQQAVAAQAEDLNEIPQRIARNARETWEIVADAGRDVAQLATTTFGVLARPAASRARKARSAAATKSSKSGARTGRKPARARRKTASKAA